MAAVVQQQDKFLLVEEKGIDISLFNQPAGHVEADEDFEQAVIRETLEETSYPFTPDYIIGVLCGKDMAQLIHRRVG